VLEEFLHAGTSHQRGLVCVRKKEKEEKKLR
jgi:hypothetical protein